jgi:hypothetical protein
MDPSGRHNLLVGITCFDPGSLPDLFFERGLLPYATNVSIKKGILSVFLSSIYARNFGVFFGKKHILRYFRAKATIFFSFCRNMSLYSSSSSSASSAKFILFEAISKGPYTSKETKTFDENTVTNIAYG